MKRVLFVDDEPRVLKGLQRAMFALDPDFEMEFAEGGKAALDKLREASFDIVVTDMMMPGINGAELLNQVMALYPDTLRIVLSGHADPALITKCLPATHQFLSKPCEPEQILSTVERTTRLHDQLRAPALRKLVGKLRHVPSKPSLYEKITKKLQDPEAGISDIAAIVQQDIGMTAKLLKLSNSAFFGIQHEVSSAEEAVSYLGVETIKGLVLNSAIFDQFSLTTSAFSTNNLWHHSLAVAALSREIMKSEGQARALAEATFTAGLLHDSGIAILAKNLGAEYNAVIESSKRSQRPIHVSENALLGGNHAELAACLLGLWGLPQALVEAIAFHHTPAPDRTPACTPLVAVHAANAFISKLCPAIPGVPAPELDEEYLEAMGYHDRIPLWSSLAPQFLSQ